MANRSTDARGALRPGALYRHLRSGFIPGLPQAVTPEEAEQLGVLELLKQAVAEGAYAEAEAGGRRRGSTEEKE